MKRFTFDGNFCDIAMCQEIPGGSFCETGSCSQKRTWMRLKEIEDILGDDYDLDRLRVILDQRMTMREDVAERMKIVGNIPIDKLKEIFKNY